MKNFKFLKIISFFTMIFISKIGFAFEIDSTRFDQRIDTGGYKEFKIKNNGTKPARYKIKVTNPEKGKESMASWIKTYPKVMNVPPMSEGILKVYAQSPSNVKEGEYFSDLIITPLIIPTLTKKDGSDKISGNSTIAFVPHIELMGYVGDPKFDKNINLKDIILKNNKDGVEISGVLENIGDIGVPIGINLLSSSNFFLDGKALGKIQKQKSDKFKVLFKNINKKDIIKKIQIYNAENLNIIKTIEL